MQLNSATLLDRLPALLGVRRDASKVQSLALVPLRLFFGVTFIYAGLQKLTDPQFFSPTAPGFIGHQMSGFVRAGSPLSGLLTSVAIPHAAQFGALIAICEVWVGLSTLLGLLLRAGALGGMAISLTLYLTTTWSVHPYFLGADLPYVVGWVTLVLAGPDLLSLDQYFFRAAPAAPVGQWREARRSRRSPGSRPSMPVPGPVSRRTAVQGLGAAAGVIVGGGFIGAIAKFMTPQASFATAATSIVTPPTGSATPPASATPGQVLLGNVKSLPLNSAGQYTDPQSGDPALLIHLQSGQFVAYDAVCTHAGCTVQYDPTQQEIVCPCHGATYDPAHGAAVINGPAQQPLATLHVTIDAKGNAYSA